MFCKLYSGSDCDYGEGLLLLKVAVRRTSQESLGFKLAALVFEHTAHGSVHLLDPNGDILEFFSAFWEKLP